MINKTSANDDVKNFLIRDKIVNLNILNFLESNKTAVVLTYGDDIENGVIAANEEMGLFFLATHNADFLRQFWDLFGDADMFFSGVPQSIADIFLADKTPEWTSPCKVYALLGDFAPIAADYPHEVLRPDDAPEVDRYYTYRWEESEAEIRRCIEKFDSACIRIDGELAAWCLIHEGDGSMGPLYTKEQYRRRGLAEIVTSRLVEKLIAKGLQPYVHIVESNDASVALAEKYSGFVYTHDCVWFGMKKISLDMNV